jgi:hypothetical protein
MKKGGGDGAQGNTMGSAMKGFSDKAKSLVSNRKAPKFDDVELATAYTQQKGIQADLGRLLGHLDALQRTAEGTFCRDSRAPLTS